MPTAGVVETQGQAWVFRVEGGKAKRTPVELGPEVDGLRIVQQGLSSGADVVSFGASELGDGKAVEVVDRRPVAPAAPARAEDASTMKSIEAGAAQPERKGSANSPISAN